MPSKDALQRLLDGLQTFIREHLALARVEMKQDLRAMGRSLAIGAAGVPALAAGYLLLMAAIALLLARWMPAWVAFGIVAIVNLAAGAALTVSGMRRVMRESMDLPRTAEEIRRDRDWLASLKQGGRTDVNGLGRPQPVALAQPRSGNGAEPPPGVAGGRDG
jgi:uncharacterized membrane protein YqjE